MSKIKENLLDDINEKVEIEELVDFRYEEEFKELSKEDYNDLVYLNYPNDKDIDKLLSEEAYIQFKNLSIEEKNTIFPLVESDFNIDAEYFNSIKEEDNNLVNEETDTNIDFNDI